MLSNLPRPVFSQMLHRMERRHLKMAHIAPPDFTAKHQRAVQHELLLPVGNITALIEKCDRIGVCKKKRLFLRQPTKMVHLSEIHIFIHMYN